MSDILKRLVIRDYDISSTDMIEEIPSLIFNLNLAA